MWYTALGTLITIVGALICSIFWGFNNPNEFDSQLIAPQLRRYFQKSHSDNPVDVRAKTQINVNESKL